MSGNSPVNPYGVPEPNGQSGQPQNGQPQFGQRSDSWTPGGTQNGTDPGVPSTPWPVYGQAGVPNQGQPGQMPPNQGAWTAQSAYQGGPTPYTPQAGAPSGPPPSRTGPIWTLVAGLILMIIVAPVLFVAMILNGIGLDRMVDGSIQTPNGGVTVVDSSGILGVTPMSGDASSCQVTNEAGETTQLNYESDSGGIWIARGLSQGSYVVECELTSAGSHLLVMNGEFIGTIVQSSMNALLAASVVGIAGLIVTIAGIVWLVKRNGARRAHYQGRSY